MRSTLLACCLLAVVAVSAGSAFAVTDTYMEYVGVAGTANYNVATNWNELLVDPSTGKYVLADPEVNRVPTNVLAPATDEQAYIRNGAVVTVVNTVPIISAIHVGAAGDTTRDAGGTIQPMPGSTLEVKSGGHFRIASYAGMGYISPHESTIGGSYDGTLNIKNGGQVTSYGELFIGASGTTNPDKTIPYQGAGYLNITTGGYLYMYSGTASRYLRIGAGPGQDTTGKGVVGTAVVDGGNINLGASSGMFVGWNGGTGNLTVNETDPSNYPTSINSGTDATLNVGTYGYYGKLGGTGSLGYWQKSVGTYTQNGGYVKTDTLNVGREHGDGLFVLNGGTYEVDTDQECRVGTGGIRSNPFGGGPFLATGNGTIIVNGGYFKSFNERTKFIVGRGSDSLVDGQAGKGIGVFIINDGLVKFNRGGNTIDNSLELGNREDSYSYGELRVLGGSLIIDKRLLFAKNETCTGVFHAGKDAYIDLGWLGLYEFEHPSVQSVAKLIVDVSETKASEINVYREVWLKGELEIRNYGWRPKEGDSWMIIKQTQYHSELLEGDFDTITSYITNGLQEDPNHPGNTLPAFKGTPIPPDPSEWTVPNPGYKITFQALTAGDANGDHMVDGGDLALMGGAWMLSGQGWGTGNFNDDPNGMVDGGDLALMGGNWMWVLPGLAPGASDATVPEPAALLLLVLGSVTMIRRRRT